MADWLNSFFVPIIKLIFLIGIPLGIFIYAGRGLYRQWKQQWKWTFKYSIFRKQYPEEIVVWCLEGINKKWNYWEAKKYLMIHTPDLGLVYETMFIYDKILNSEIKNGNIKVDKHILGSNLPDHKQLKGGEKM